MHRHPQETQRRLSIPNTGSETQQVRGGKKPTELCRAGAGDILHMASVWLSFWAQSPGFVSHPPLNVPSSLLLPDWVSGFGRARRHVSFEEMKGSGGPSPTAALKTLRRRQLPTDQLFRPNPKHQLMVYGQGAGGLEADHKRRKLNRPRLTASFLPVPGCCGTQ